MPKQQKKTQFEFAVGKTIKTPTGRLVFRDLAKPGGLNPADPRFSITLVVKPGPQFDILMNETVALREKVFGGMDVFFPIKSGDEVLSEKENAPEKVYAGNFVIKAGSGLKNRKGAIKPPPVLYDVREPKGQQVVPRRSGEDSDVRNIDELFYPGCYVRAVVTPYTYKNISTGVGLLLKAVQFMADGQRIGVSEDYDAMFGDDTDSDYRIGDESDMLEDETENTALPSDLNI